MSIEVPAANEPALGDVLSWIWARRLALLVGVIVGLAGAATYYLIARPQFSADIVLMPLDDTESAGRLSGLLGQLGGVGSLLGMGFGGESAAQRNLAVFKSRAFAEQFIQSRDLMPQLFWKRWNPAAKTWNDDGKEPPSLAEGVRKFEKIRSIAEDRRAGLVTVSIKWHDAKVAAAWSNDLIAFANQVLRQQAIDESQVTIQYLDTQISTTQALGVRDALFRVLESQMKTMTLAKTRTDYAFRVIDPAQPPLRRDRVSPRLLPTAFSGIAGGALLGLLGSLLMQRSGQRKS